jgi:hypothetical protein
MVNESNKVAGYKINIQKSVVFLYINELSEKEIMKAITFTTATTNEMLKHKSSLRNERPLQSKFKPQTPDGR